MTRTGYNALNLTGYNSSGTALNADLDTAQDVGFTTVYPGGLFAALSFYVPGVTLDTWALVQNSKIIARNGLATVWDGKVTGLQIAYQGDTAGVSVTCLGYWASVLMRRGWRKWWADTRMSEAAWPEATTAYSANDETLLQKMHVDRLNRIRFTPKAVAFANGKYHRVIYAAPTGETVKRVTFNYDLQEAAQAWVLALYSNNTVAVLEWSVSASGTGSGDVTLATPDQYVFFLLQSGAAQTPASDGTIYGELSSIVVYTETGSINLTEIAKDVRADVTELSANETLIASNTFALVPFISEVDTYADILTVAASYGDATFDAWACGIRESEIASDSKPILFVEQQPALTDYDYAIRLDEPNLVAPFTAEQDTSEIKNWIAATYQDETGRTVVVTPDDDANLKDATSITAYGEIHEWIDVQTTSLTNAKNYARRILAARKDPQWIVSSGIGVVGYIRGKGGEIVPASEIRAGKRVRVENFLSDLNGTGLTLLITGTSYNDASETNQLSVGRPDVLATWLARQG